MQRPGHAARLPDRSADSRRQPCRFGKGRSTSWGRSRKIGRWRRHIYQGGRQLDREGPRPARGDASQNAVARLAGVVRRSSSFTAPGIATSRMPGVRPAESGSTAARTTASWPICWRATAKPKTSCGGGSSKNTWSSSYARNVRERGSIAASSQRPHHVGQRPRCRRTNRCR